MKNILYFLIMALSSSSLECLEELIDTHLELIEFADYARSKGHNAYAGGIYVSLAEKKHVILAAQNPEENLVPVDLSASNGVVRLALARLNDMRLKNEWNDSMRTPTPGKHEIAIDEFNKLQSEFFARKKK